MRCCDTRHLGRGARPDVEPDVHVHPGRLICRQGELVEQGPSAGAAADHADEPDPGVEGTAYGARLGVLDVLQETQLTPGPEHPMRLGESGRLVVDRRGESPS